MKTNGVKTMKTSELKDLALDWAVECCECGDDIAEIDDPHFYSTDAARGFPIVQRENIKTKYVGDAGFAAWISRGVGPHTNEHSQYGPTPLIAAMRCYVASRLGDEVEVPQELI